VKIVFHPEAERELNEAVDYYEQCRKNLGREFLLEVYSAVERINAYPTAWPVIEDHIRRCLIRRFPFGVLYHTEQEKILILAIMHLHRRPGYWKERGA
jgi:plasmid stabilization system protein ParE